jgi:flagellar basal-body rod protein FlgC
VYDPDHPDADEKGYLHLPNVNPIEEMVNLMSATEIFRILKKGIFVWIIP